MNRALIVSATAIAVVALAACGVSIAERAERYDFGGVYEDSLAGAIDRDKASRRPAGPPNIVLIIADDLGWPYLGFLGDENVMTPNMDVIGDGGAVFEVGHSTSNHCRPTLQSLITGLYPVQYDARAQAIVEDELQKNTPEEVDTDQEIAALRQQYETSAIQNFDTLPRLLAGAGYVSHQSGKWWEQSYAHGGFTHGMTGGWSWQDVADLGGNFFFSFMGGQGMDIGRNTMEPVEEFIETHADQPFFVWYGPALPHQPLNPPYKFYKYFADRTDLSESAKLYYGNIAWFDWGVGKLLDSLEENGVLGDTLIVYVNDNGWEQPPGEEYAGDTVTFGNGGPRGKGSFFETGMRTPIIFYWADQIAAQRDRASLVSAIDIVPTLLDYAGVEAPDDLPGYSLRPAIEGESLPSPRDAIIGKLTTHRAGTDFRGEPSDSVGDLMGGPLEGYYLRDQRWHFVMLTESDEMALYDLDADPGQTRDVSADQPELIAEFKSAIAAWRETYEAG